MSNSDIDLFESEIDLYQSAPAGELYIEEDLYIVGWWVSLYNSEGFFACELFMSWGALCEWLNKMTPYSPILMVRFNLMRWMNGKRI